MKARIPQSDTKTPVGTILPIDQLPLFLSGAFLTSLASSLVGTYFVRGWAIRRGYVDHPDIGRRIHAAPTPRVGGVAIALATLVSFTAWGALLFPDFFARREILSMVAGGCLIFLLGFWDDTRNPRAMTKFVWQVAIASLVFLGGVRILGVSFGAVWSSQLGAAAALGVTVLWIVGTTNAFNLIDGSDGVAGGAALFASVSMGVVFALHGDALGALMATVLVGACLGFLFFNFPPASIFMGDSGSLFLGFTLATLGVITTQKSSTLLAVAIPIIAFAVPLLDTVIAIVRRYLRRDSIFEPDRGHIHHRLRDLGLSSRTVAVFLYVACAACAWLSMMLAAPGRPTVVPVFVVAAAVLVLIVQRLRMPELIELSRVMGRSLQQRAVIHHNVRVHSLAVATGAARSGTELLEALRQSFEASEFAAVEVWVDGLHGSALADVEGAHRHGGGYRVRLDFVEVLRPEQAYEIRVPLVFSHQGSGRISLTGLTGGDRLFTDVRLVAQLVAPSVVSTLERLGDAAAKRQAQKGH